MKALKQVPLHAREGNSSVFRDWIVGADNAVTQEEDSGIPFLLKPRGKRKM